MPRVRADHNAKYSHLHGYAISPLGQFDPSTGIVGDVMLGPEDTAPIPVQPEYGTTETHGFYDYGASTDQSPQPGPTVSVPKPPSSGVIPAMETFGSPFPGTSTSSQGQLPPGPAPRVNVPLSATGGFQLWLSNNFPLVLGGVVGLVLLSSMSGGRRRR